MKINISTYLPNSLRQEREFDAFLQFFICYVNSLKNLIWQMHEFYLTLVKIDVAKNCTISCIILLLKKQILRCNKYARNDLEFRVRNRTFAISKLINGTLLLLSYVLVCWFQKTQLYRKSKTLIHIAATHYAHKVITAS